MTYMPGIIDSDYPAVPYATDGGVGFGELMPPDVSAGPDFGNLVSAGKGIFKMVAPETYSAATSWLPSGAEIASGLGLEMGSGAAASALGGAAMAFGYAAPAYAIAQFLASIGDTGDTSMLLGYGEGENLGEFLPTYGRPQHRAAAGDLYGDFIGDRDWYGGGDPNAVGRMPSAVGLMSVDKGTPYWSVGGMPYESAPLAIASGRQIARGMMDLPVTHEALPRLGAAQDPLYAQYQGNRSMPVYDAPALLPDDWDTFQDRQMGSPLSGQSNTEASQGWAPEVIEARIAGMPQRQQDWARTGMTTGQIFAATGENSPDYAGIVDDLSGVRGEVENLSPSGRSVPGYSWGTF